MARLVSDEVWQQLDPQAGRLQRRTAARLWWAAGVGTAIALVWALVWQLGVAYPRLGWSNSGYGSGGGPGWAEHEVVVENQGWTPLTIVAVGRSGPGLELTEVRGTFPVTLQPGDQTSFYVVYRVTDCTAVSNEPFPVPVRVERWWGEQTAYIEIPTYPSRDRPGSYSYSGQDPYAVQWQRGMADFGCHPG